MRSAAWASLLRVIPPELTEKLMAVMTSGNEINISGVIRFEHDFMVVRGRLAGTTDDPSVVFVPYDQIDYMGFRVGVKDAELMTMFENAGFQNAPTAMEYAMAPTTPVMQSPP